MTTSTPPRVSILTPVYNSERYLDQTIASILGQSFDDFEYVLVNDASTDSSPAILARWAARDARIRVFHNAQNLNTAGALNRGLREVRGEYVAMLDHDDIAFPTRLAAQVAYMDAHPEIGVLGTQCITIGPDGEKRQESSYPIHPAVTQWRLAMQPPLIQSSAMVRRHLFDQVGGYSTKRWLASDFDMFMRLGQVTDICNLTEQLVAYRVFPEQISQQHPSQQSGQALLLIQSYLTERFGFSAANLPAIHALYWGVRGHMVSSEAALELAGALLVSMHAAFVTKLSLTPEGRQLVDDDCAFILLMLAWKHRRTMRAASRAQLARAIAIVPDLWQKPMMRAALRKLYRKDAERQLLAGETPIDG